VTRFELAEATRGNGVESQPMDDAGRRLGLGCPISRQDFLGGVALSVGAIAAGLPGAAGAAGEAPQDQPGYAPAAREGLRGSGPGSFEIAHDVRDGDFAALREATVATGERYDLVVVGAGSADSRRRASSSPTIRPRASSSSIITTTSAATRGATSSSSTAGCC